MPKDDFQISRIEAIVERGVLTVAITYGSEDKRLKGIDMVSYLAALDELAEMLGIPLEMYVQGVSDV